MFYFFLIILLYILLPCLLYIVSCVIVAEIVDCMQQTALKMPSQQGKEGGLERLHGKEKASILLKRAGFFKNTTNKNRLSFRSWANQLSRQASNVKNKPSFCLKTMKQSTPSIKLGQVTLLRKALSPGDVYQLTYREGSQSCCCLLGIPVGAATELLRVSNRNNLLVKPKVKFCQAALVVAHMAAPCCPLQVLVLGPVAVRS